MPEISRAKALDISCHDTTKYLVQIYIRCGFRIMHKSHNNQYTFLLSKRISVLMINLTKLFYCESACYIFSLKNNPKATNIKKKWKQHMKKIIKYLNFFKLLDCNIKFLIKWMQFFYKNEIKK